jgi:hypothetical protein
VADRLVHHEEHHAMLEQGDANLEPGRVLRQGIATGASCRPELRATVGWSVMPNSTPLKTSMVSSSSIMMLPPKSPGLTHSAGLSSCRYTAHHTRCARHGKVPSYRFPTTASHADATGQARRQPPAPGPVESSERRIMQEATGQPSRPCWGGWKYARQQIGTRANRGPHRNGRIRP